MIGTKVVEKETVLTLKPAILGTCAFEEEEALIEMYKRMSSRNAIEGHTGSLTMTAVKELLRALVRNPKRIINKLFMDHQDKVAYFQELPKLWGNELIGLPGMIEGYNKVIGKKVYREKSKFASEENIDAHLRTIFGTTFVTVYEIFDDPNY